MRRAVGLGGGAVEHRIPRGIAVDAERPARGGQVRVHEEPAEAGIRHVLLDPAPDPGFRRGRHGLPRATRTVGTLGKPHAVRCPAEQPLVLRPADGELEADALVSRQQRQEAVGGGGADRLEPSVALEGPQSGDDVAVERAECATQALQTVAPELDQRQQRALARRGERRGRLVAGGETLGDERLHLLHEGRARELVGEHRRHAERDRGRDPLGLERP